MQRILTRSLLIWCVAVAAEEAAPKKAKQAEKRRPSTLAPVVNYLEVWTHIHAKDAGVPKILLLLDGDDASIEVPSWFSTAAMRYKEGRKKKAAFVAVNGGGEAQKAAARFGMTASIPAGGALFACMVGESEGGGYAVKFDGSLGDGGAAGERTRAVREFVDDVLGGVAESARLPLPAFPEPSRPRKAAPVTLEELDHESLQLKCYGVQAKPLCVLAILNAPANGGCPTGFAQLARRFANDPVGFGCVGAARQHEFLTGFGLDASTLPAMVAVKAGKRPRYVPYSGASLDDVGAMGAFVDSILGGGATFKRVTELPTLEPPYLLDGADGDEGTKEEL